MRKIALAGFISLSSVTAGYAQDASDKTTIIHAGQMLDVESGKLLQDRFIIIDGDTIRNVLTLNDMEDMEEEDIDFIDLSNMYVLPGLTDAHVHLTSDANVHGYKRLTRSTPRAAITGVRNAKRTLMAGFTTVRNVGAPGFTDVDLMEAIEDGDVPGPTIIPAGRSIGITGGHCDNNLLPFENRRKAGGVADGPWAVRAKVRENKKFGAKVIKFCGTGGVLSKGTKVGAQQFAFEEMKAIVDEAHLLGMKVAVHAHGQEGINTAIEAGVDSVEHSSFISDAGIRAVKANGTYLSMDVYVSDYILSEGEAAGILEESLAKERTVGKIQRERFQAAVKAGAKMAYGTDAGVYPHGDNGRQLAYMVKWGMSPLQAIQTATINNAKLFGLESQIGSLKSGKMADIIAVENNPLSDVSELEHVDFVMKGGAVFKSKVE
ncbi:Xaa-Pro dipeptidase [Hellea balneolensis]|uniref:Xaa-Pro dipeptidase n=1 Tax=Hellea balneolensis TaxID=287478 RepID=UPI00040BAD4F|nr:amidohydrolase family protein [Hellea balneolensis]